MELIAPRWKGKGSTAIAEANSMSQIILQLQSTLLQQETHATLCDCAALLDAKQWFQLDLDETFYMTHQLQCLKVASENDQPMDDPELWEYITSRIQHFLSTTKAYAHLRNKNWLVHSGTHYGVDFVAYRHHPALVHSE